MKLEEISFEEFLMHPAVSDIRNPPHLDHRILNSYARTDSTYLDSYRVMLVDDVPMFGSHTNEDKDEKIWRLYMEDMLLVPVFNLCAEVMAKAVETVAATTQIPVMTLPAAFIGTHRYCMADDCSKGFWLKDHVVDLYKYKGGETSKQRNEISKSLDLFDTQFGSNTVASSRVLYPDNSDDVALVQEIIRDQPIYWRARRGVTSIELDYAIRLWLWAQAAWLFGKAVIVVVQHPDAGGHYISAAAFVQLTSDVPTYAYTSFAQTPTLPKLNRVGVATLHKSFACMKELGMSSVYLGVSSDAFTEFTYMNYKKHVSTDMSSVCAFAALDEPSSFTKPPYYNIKSSAWVFE